MSPRQASGWCARCKRQILVLQQASYRELFAGTFLVALIAGLFVRTTPLGSLVLFVITPLALVCWLVSLAVCRDKWRCQTCGGSDILEEDPEEVARRRSSPAGKREAFWRWAYPVIALVTLAALLVAMELFTRSKPG